jgi:transcriptional repressor NrdR
MKCPYCSFLESKVTDSRNAPETNSIRRRRECLRCLKRFTTFETVDLTIQVRKRDGSFQDFSQEKLVRGLDAACRRTKVSHEQVLAIAAEMAAQIAERQLKQIDSTEIGEIVMAKLKSLDTVAYIRFACVYRRFKDMDELMNVINTAQFS